MGHQQLYWSHPRKFGQGSRSCRVCSNRHGLIRKYGLNMCRQCFRQYAKDIGFIKTDLSSLPSCCLWRWQPTPPSWPPQTPPEAQGRQKEAQKVHWAPVRLTCQS
ncbi:40S ribosomal protein S29 isoform X1 [Sapajus apella]|uniref:Small ribosomal subunit protein uS14 n=1 Tax=Sapajus apella TaxID=9515 RepID=A0A6J3F4J5_SAPAP|nr:40S ribosomal protein S29 isoform X1 [Sapajus apella]